MTDLIGRFSAKPTVARPRMAHPNEQMVFVIHPAHAAAVWTVLNLHKMPYDFEHFFSGTRSDAHARQREFWFSIPQDSPGIAALADICHLPPYGMALSCPDPKAALVHARTVLEMETTTGTGVPCFFSPPCWAAVALSGDVHELGLLGPCSAVFTPAPAADKQLRRWHVWENPSPDPCPLETRLPMPSDWFAAYETLRQVFWLREHPAFAEVADRRLPALVSNLNTLVAHGIGEEQHGLSLAPLLCGVPLTQRATVMKTLKQAGPTHRRVAQLREVKNP